MGQSESRISYSAQPPVRPPPVQRNAYRNWEFKYDANWPDDKSSFATLSFAEGASRRAYRAMHWKPVSKYGTKAVVKEYKASYAWAQGDWDTAVNTYEKAKELAKKFNEVSATNHPIHIVYYDIQKVVKQPTNATPKLGEWILVEDYLEGDFQKFVSNTGWVKPLCLTSYNSMPAFSHWTWVYTKGQLMVTDLQGVRYDDKYVLTDPCIVSINREYGANDLALLGMCLFFMTHQCTDMCRSLNIAAKRPDLKSMDVFYKQEILVKMVQAPTSYLSEEEYEELPKQLRIQLRYVMVTALSIRF